MGGRVNHVFSWGGGIRRILCPIKGNCSFSIHNILLWISFTSSDHRRKIVSGKIDEFNKDVMNIVYH